MSEPDPRSRDRTTPEQQRKRDRHIRATLLPLILLINCSTAITSLVLLGNGDLGLVFQIVGIGIAVGLVINPVRLMLCIGSDDDRMNKVRREQRQRGDNVERIGADGFQSARTTQMWKESLIQTGVILSLVVLIGFTLPVFLLVRKEPFVEFCVFGVWGILGAATYMLRSPLNTIAEAVSRAVER